MSRSRRHDAVRDARHRVGASARALEGVLDELARTVGENDDRPRVLVTAVRRWAEGRRASSGAYNETLDAAAAAPSWVHRGQIRDAHVSVEQSRALRSDPWTYVWCALSRLMLDASRAKRGTLSNWVLCSDAAEMAVRLASPGDDKGHSQRVRGEFRRAHEEAKRALEAA